MRKDKKSIEKDYDSNFDDYCKINEKENEIYMINQLNKLPIHIKLGEFISTDVLMDSDATSLYPSAMWDEKSIYPEIETGYAFTPDMNVEIVEKFNDQLFTPGSALLKILYYSPPDLSLQDLPVREKVNKFEVNPMRNGYTIDTLTSVVTRDIVKIGQK